MAGKSDIFSGPLAGWEPIDSSSKGMDSSATTPQKADRVAQEFSKVAGKYVPDSDASQSKSVEHSTLLRVKKKGTLDNDVNAKTFVLQGSKVIGSQG